MTEDFAASSSYNVDKALGIVGVVFGVLILLGEFTIGWIVPLLGVMLIAFGIFVAVGVVRGGGLLGIVLASLGLLLLSGLLGGAPAVAVRAVHLIVGAALVVLGFIKLA